MNDDDRSRLVHRARNTKNLSGSDVHELKKMWSVQLQPFKSAIDELMSKAHSDDDAVILKVAIKGESSLNSNERFRLDEAIKKRGRRPL